MLRAEIHALRNAQQRAQTTHSKQPPSMAVKIATPVTMRRPISPSSFVNQAAGRAMAPAPQVPAGRMTRLLSVDEKRHSGPHAAPHRRHHRQRSSSEPRKLSAFRAAGFHTAFDLGHETKSVPQLPRRRSNIDTAAARAHSGVDTGINTGTEMSRDDDEPISLMSGRMDLITDFASEGGNAGIATSQFFI